LDLFCFAWASSQIKKRIMMKTFTLACVVLLLTHGGNAQCVTEDTALDVCMETAGLGDVAKEACDVCVVAAAAATSAIMTTTCEELASGDNNLCVALGLCPTCPVGCSAEMDAYALCEVNDELALGCQTLECNVADPETPTTAPAPTAAGSTPTEAAPAEAGSTPTEAAPTEAGSTPTEAPPTDTPTSMASPTYTKIGAFVAGLLAVTALF
jgi:cell division septation protein DedD